MCLKLSISHELIITITLPKNAKMNEIMSEWDESTLASNNTHSQKKIKFNGTSRVLDGTKKTFEEA